MTVQKLTKPNQKAYKPVRGSDSEERTGDGKVGLCALCPVPLYCVTACCSHLLEQLGPDHLEESRGRNNNLTVRAEGSRVSESEKDKSYKSLKNKLPIPKPDFPQ